MAIFLQIVSFLVQNRAQIKQLILDIQNLIPDAPGADKAGLVKSFIAASLQVEGQIESAWPFVAPLFNAFVSDTKLGK